MRRPKTVKPISAEGNNMTLLQLFGKGPLWTITCGGCRATFEKRLPLVDNPGVSCPHCGAVNVIPITWESDAA